jgi:hypothetical protein
MFSEGLAWFGTKGKYGFINTNGEQVIKPVFHRVRQFSEGLAAVRPENGDWGFINTDGKYVIEPQFEDITPFKYGYAQVNMWKVKHYINKMGEVLLNPPVKYFKEGLAPVNLGSPYKGEWGYVDEHYRFVIEPQFQEALEFSEGLAAVKDTNGNWGYIDRTGNYVIEPIFGFAKPFKNGVAVVGIGGVPKMFYPIYARRYAKGKLGYIDPSGNFIWIQTE